MKPIVGSIFVIMLLVLGACGDDESVDIPNYTVNIVQPNSDAKKVGEIMHVHVNFDEDNQGIVHHIDVTLIDQITGDTIYSKPDIAHVHEASGHYEHHDDIILNVNPNSTLSLQAKVWGHEAGLGLTSSTVIFEVEP